MCLLICKHLILCGVYLRQSVRSQKNRSINIDKVFTRLWSGQRLSRKAKVCQDYSARFSKFLNMIKIIVI